jgi:esterase/lipase superfamily enzyme/putative methionine-R-sulfoxide reductase with GAF domain
MSDRAPGLPRADIDVRDVLDTFWLAAWVSRLPSVAEGVTAPVPDDTPAPTRDGDETLDRPTAMRTTSTDTSARLSPSGQRAPQTAGGLYAPGGAAQATSDSTTRARPIRIPAGSALPNSLRIARAMRAIPARLPSRVDVELDEDATVDASARGLGIVPVLRSRFERWFEAALVVDHSASAEMWAQTVIELQRTLTLSGIFRDVRTYTLEHTPSLRLLNESGVTQRLNALRDPTARRIVFIFSPGVTEAWTDGRFGWLTNGWGATTPVVLLHALPRRLWTSTALGEPLAFVVNPTLGGPNTGLTRKRAWWARARRIDGPRSTLPVFALDADSTRRWAEMFAARRGRSAPAFLVPMAARAERRTREGARPQPSLQERIDLFRTHAPDAFKLAVRLAVGPFTMPILRLVQSSLFGREADHAQVAELMLSGLVARLTPLNARIPPEQVQFQFTREASPLLLESLRRDDARQLSALLQGYIEQHFGAARDQVVLLDDPEGPAVISGGARPFAQLDQHFLQWLEKSSPRTPASGVAPTIAKALVVYDTVPPEAEPEAVPGGAEPPRDAKSDDGSLSDTFERLRTEAGPLTGLRILWVDDQPSNNSSQLRRLRELGVEDCTAVTSTAQGLKALETTAFDIVLTDMARPEGPEAGLRLLTAVRERHPKMPVIIYAARWVLLEDNRRRALAAGAFGCTNQTRELVDLVREAAPSGRARRFKEHFHRELGRSPYLAPLAKDLMRESPHGAAVRVAQAVSDSTERTSAFVVALSAISESRYVQLFRMERGQLWLAGEHLAPGSTRYGIASLKGLIGRAAQTKRTVWAPDVTQVAGYIAAEKSTRSELVIPVLDAGADVRFVVNIERDAANAYSTSQVRWLEEFVHAYLVPSLARTSTEFAVAVPPKSAFRYWSYASYSEGDRDPALERFLQDLAAEVTALTGDAEVGLTDRRHIAESGWSLPAALRSSRTLLAIITPRYLAGRTWQLEWEAFDTQQKDQAEAILPVIWTPLPRNLPDALARVQIADPTLPEAYTRQGLRLLGQRRTMRDLYKLVVSRLASVIVDTGMVRENANISAAAEEVPQARAPSVHASRAVVTPDARPDAKPGTFDVVLSYTRADEARASKVASALESSGFTVWRDSAITSDMFAHAIRHSLDTARTVVVLWSTTTVASKFVLAEVGEARRTGRLIPVLIDPIAPPSEFDGIHVADLTQWLARGAPNEFDRLVKTIVRLVHTSADAIVSDVAPDTFDAGPRRNVVQLLVATTRKPTGERDPAVAYGSERGELQTLIIDVSIPQEHRLGSVEQPSWWRLEFGEDARRHVVMLGSRQVLADELTFGPSVGAESAPGLVIVHGWNTSFDYGVMGAAALSHDLAVSGRTFLYAWPSQGRATSYPADVAAAEASAPGLRDVLVRATGNRNAVDLIAWDVGCLILMRAFAERLAGSRVEWRNLILVAPDLEAHVFWQQAREAIHSVSHIILYVITDSASNSMSALGRRESIRPQAPKDLDEFVDIIEVRDNRSVETSHSYFGQSARVWRDIYGVLREQQPASRPGVSSAADGGWILD